MAPEQLEGREVTVRSDIYSLGLVLYEIFTGQRALDAKTMAELIAKREQAEITPPTAIVRDLDETIERGKAFADAGASGFFVPRLSDPRQVERVVKEVPLPLNLIAFPGAPPNSDWANAGAARISYGPFPHRALMAQLTELASAAIS